MRDMGGGWYVVCGKTYHVVIHIRYSRLEPAWSPRCDCEIISMWGGMAEKSREERQALSVSCLW